MKTSVFDPRRHPWFSALSLALMAVPIAGAPPAPPSESLSQPLISSEVIASFQFQGELHKIWASLRNRPDMPTLWQFRYDPAIVPECNAQGSMSVHSEPFAGHQRTYLSLYLDQPGVRLAAFESLKGAYPKEAAFLQPDSVQPIEIQRLSIEIPELTDAVPAARLAMSSFDFLAPPHLVTIAVESPSSETAATLEQVLPRTTIKYQLSFYAKHGKVNQLSVTRGNLKATTLYARLNGLPSNTVFVHRDDFRTLCENISHQVVTSGIIEDTKDFDLKAAESLAISFINFTADKPFDQAMLQSTFNGKDLDPNVLTHTLNQEFTKEQSKDEWKRNANVDTGGNVSLLKILSAGGHMKGSYSGEELKELLKEHGLHVEIEGTQIVPKSIDLLQVNKAWFDQEDKVVQVFTYVTGQGVADYPGFLNLYDAARAKDAYPDIDARVLDLRGAMPPVGAIVPFFLGADEIKKLAPMWRPADGSPLKDPLSPLCRDSHGNVAEIALPDLTNRVVLGAPASDNILENSERTQPTIVKTASGATSGAIVVHTTPTGQNATGGQDDHGNGGCTDRLDWVHEDWNNMNFILDTAGQECRWARHTHGCIVSLPDPPHRKLIYLIRCREAW